MNSVINRRFGTSQRLELNNAEWLGHGMSSKTVRFEMGQGGLAPSVNWEDRSAAIALIKDRHVKALASILLWGGNSSWDKTECFNAVVNHLSALMIERCEHDGQEAPSYHSLEEMARLMARMTLHFELYQLWSVYTVEGQLFFSGIKVPVKTYSRLWSGYKNKILEDLEDLVVLVDADISQYRFNLNGSYEVSR